MIKIKKSTKRKIENNLLKAFYIFAGLYLVWHFGRWYEFQQYKKQFEKVERVMTNTYYFIAPEVIDPFLNTTKELYITGKIEAGMCLPTGQEIEWLGGIILRK